jgi:hypothetical protein
MNQMGSFTACPAEEMSSDVFTSFLFLRYRLHSFKVGADVLHQYGMIIVI